MKWNLASACVAGLALALVTVAFPSAATAMDVADIPWVTNLDDPPIGDPNAKKGGTIYSFTTAYPLTWRIIGPNANDGFAGWRRSCTMDFNLVVRHPNTDNWIPWVASHWYVADDKTVYYKIDDDAKWSDGKPITADDFVFTLEMMRSEHIVDPYYNEYFSTIFESIEKLDTRVIKITGKQSSWRPLADLNTFPMPKHQHTLDDGWVDRMHNEYPLSIGPYTVASTSTGQNVVYKRDPQWWGYGKHYFQGMWNADKIHIHTGITTDKALDFFKKGELSFFEVNTAKTWAQDMEFPAIKKGWAHRKRVFVDYPTGMYGFSMNLEKPIFQNKDFRKAIQYLFNFDEINEKLMFGAYFRQTSAFTGTEYANPNLKPYGFDPRKAREHLAKAGYTKRENGIFVNDKGGRAAFVLTYGSKGLERHLTVVKETFKRFGVDMSLRLLEPATSFERGLEREYEMILFNRTSGFYPSPHGYFLKEFAETKNNNNLWGFGTDYTDELINTYRFNLDKETRVAALYELDAIVHDEAFYVPFWFGPYKRFVYWDHVQWPENFIPKRMQVLATDYMVYWVDTERKARLEEAMKNDTSLGQDAVVDVDPHGVKARLEGALRGDGS